MCSLEVASDAAASYVPQAFPHTHPTLQIDGAAERNALANQTNVIDLIRNFGPGSTFPHLTFLPEPPRGSLRQLFEGSNVKWDIVADCKLKSELESINTVLDVAQSDAAPSASLADARDCSVRLMQIVHRGHPAWLRLQAQAAAPSLWQEFLQRMTALSDTNSMLSSFSKTMDALSRDCISSAGCSAPAAGGVGPGEHKRQCVEAAYGYSARDLDKDQACSGCLDGVNWNEELRCLDQEKAQEETSTRERSILEPERRSDHLEVDDARGTHIHASSSELCAEAAGFCESPTLTEEQKMIIELADAHQLPPPCVRVVAAAGTGKTTTLVHIVRRLQAEASHKRILYLVYNKEFQLQAQRSLGTSVTCLTLDACAGRYGFQDAVLGWQRLEDKEFKRGVGEMLRAEIDKMSWVDDSKREADTPTAEIQKALMVRWVLKTLSLWMQRSLVFEQIFEMHDEGTVFINQRKKMFLFYPCYLECSGNIDSKTGKRSNRLPSLSRECNRGRAVLWYMEKALEAWQAMENGKFAPAMCSGPCGTHEYWMKKAQLEARIMPFDVILLDEAQDVTECQLTWAIQKQKQAMRFCVGDPCQSIYGFRGAILESEFESIMRDDLTCKPMLLSQSFRFGCDIARVANAILFVRFNLKDCVQNTVRFRYHVHGKSKMPGIAVHSASPEAAQLLSSAYTLVARTNVQLVKEVLQLWEKDATVKIHVNGATTRNKFRDCLQAIEAAFPLFARCEGAKYKKFSSWSALKRHADMQSSDDGDDEASVLVMMVQIIEMYRDQTLIKCDNFKRAVLANYSANEADVIVTTTHQAKGMEFDTVRLCDDFADLCVFEKNEAKFRQNSSDVNLWYVAVTRARRVLVLPPKFMELPYKIQETLDDCASTTGVDGANPVAVSLRARAKLFHNWPLPLLVPSAEAPSSPARARSVGEVCTS